MQESFFALKDIARCALEETEKKSPAGMEKLHKELEPHQHQWFAVEWTVKQETDEKTYVSKLRCALCGFEEERKP